MNPMYLDKIAEKIAGGKYAKVSQFAHDCHLIVQNSRLFNKGTPGWMEVGEDLMRHGQSVMARVRALS